MLAVRSQRYDDSRLPHKVHVAAVQLLVAAVPIDRLYVTFDELRAAAPQEVAAELTDGVLSQILLDLGEKLVDL